MTLTRRRFIAIAAAAAGAAIPVAATARSDTLVWTGTALGADARLLIAGLTPAEAETCIARARAEIDRLEAAFSLYRPDSELSRLNRDGQIDRPSQDFRLLLGHSLEAWQQTDGAFNPAIQPVWQFLARHFDGPDRDRAPDPLDLGRKLALCDPGRIALTPNRVRLAPGMALTFNGIAQGYITDRVATIFESRGLRDILVDLGEIYALPGRRWDVAVAGSDRRLALSQRAVAQSAGAGTPFTADRSWHHLIDPATGHSANRFAAVTVAAPSATVADLLSTALYVAPPQNHTAILRRHAGAEAFTAT